MVFLSDVSTLPITLVLFVLGDKSVLLSDDGLSSDVSRDQSRYSVRLDVHQTVLGGDERPSRWCFLSNPADEEQGQKGKCCFLSTRLISCIIK